MNNLRMSILFMLVPVALAAQSMAIPRSGVIFDAKSHSLRSIDGVPGSATLGDAFASAGTVNAAAVCSTRQFALLLGGDPETPSVLQFGRAHSAPLPAAAFQSPSQIVLSASCSAALLYSVEGSQAQVITGLPDAPAIGATISLPLTGISVLALSDDASSVLAVVPGDGVYVTGPSLPPMLLVKIAGAGAVAFRDKQDALVADTQGDRILLVPNVLAASTPQILAGPDQGISLPVSIGLDVEKQLVIFGNSGTAEVGLLNPVDGSVKLVGCGCQGSALSTVSKYLYEIAAPLDGAPLLLLDITGSPYKVLFVPARS